MGGPERVGVAAALPALMPLGVREEEEEEEMTVVLLKGWVVAEVERVAIGADSRCKITRVRCLFLDNSQKHESLFLVLVYNS